jgi:hypothetical protein
VAFCLYESASCVTFYVYYDSVGSTFYSELECAYYDEADYYIEAAYPEYTYELSIFSYDDRIGGDDYGYGFSEYMFMAMDWDYSSDDMPDGAMYFWRFQNTAGDYYYAVGDEAVVWTIATTDSADNTDTDVTMAGAASLAAATTAVAAVLATM